MKEKNWKKLANELMELIGESTPATKVKAKVENSRIELYPEGDENDGGAFFHIEEVVDFCRVKKLSSYVTMDFERQNVICVIY